MIEQKSYPYYLPDNKEILKDRAAVMFTYEQILTIASAMAELQKLNHKFFSGVHLADSELSLTTAIHNSCINCAMSMEEHKRLGDSTNGKE